MSSTRFEGHIRAPKRANGMRTQFEEARDAAARLMLGARGTIAIAMSDLDHFFWKNRILWETRATEAVMWG